MGAFAHHPDLARAFFGFNGHILYGTTLSLRQRQLLVLRVAAVRQCGYLWLQHLAQRADADLTDEDVDHIAVGPVAPFGDPLDAAFLRAVDELIVDARIGEETWRVLTAKLDTRQMLDLIFTVGCYDTVARMCGSLELGLETDVGEDVSSYDFRRPRGA